MSRQKKSVDSAELPGNDVFYEDEETSDSEGKQVSKKKQATKQNKDGEGNYDHGKTVSIYEASQQFATSELTIKTWVDHGHLTSVNGRIPVRSIRECRFNTRRFV